MKKLSVYTAFLILLGMTVLFSTGCSRKSGCAATIKTTKPVLKKDGSPKRKSSTQLFGKKTRKKM